MALVGITLAAGVVTWAFSPIEFQTDMGILLNPQRTERVASAEPWHETINGVAP